MISLRNNFSYWEPLKHFLADCLNKQELFIYEDPISNMIINVGKQGEKFNWHFDTNEFTITLLLQAADSGGIFEYIPNLRKPDDECFDEVAFSDSKSKDDDEWERLCNECAFIFD